jgi:hypothetical protein
LQWYQGQNVALESRVVELEDCEEQVEELSKHNRFLEEKVRELSTLPPPKEERDENERRLMSRN